MVVHGSESVEQITSRDDLQKKFVLPSVGDLSGKVISFHFCQPGKEKDSNSPTCHNNISRNEYFIKQQAK